MVKSVYKGVFDLGIEIWWEQRLEWQKKMLWVLASFRECELVEKVKIGEGFEEYRLECSLFFGEKVVQD